jgi:hypothetical protein
MVHPNELAASFDTFPWYQIAKAKHSPAHPIAGFKYRDLIAGAL